MISSLNPSQKECLLADLDKRNHLSEMMGEEGAENLIKEKGWKSLLTRSNKQLNCGFDQVYRCPWGKLQVVEAKGGTSGLRPGYGYIQGSPEWAVEASKVTLKMPGASQAEMEVARLVLQAASKKELTVHTFQTPHFLGEPKAPRIRQSVACTEEAQQLAKPALIKIGEEVAIAAPLGPAVPMALIPREILLNQGTKRM